MSAVANDPFDPCGWCGHTLRCHDSAGCGKWVEAKVTYDWKIDAAGNYGGVEMRILQAHTCHCRGFRKVLS